MRDGILKRPATDPLVIHVDTANEFWQMNASLNVHDGRGKPVPIPDNVRLYFAVEPLARGRERRGRACRRPKGRCEYPTNGARSYETLLRALHRGARRVGRQRHRAAEERLSGRANGTLVTSQRRHARSRRFRA